jgi:hypothetical protein
LIKRLKNASNKALKGHFWGPKHTFKRKARTKGKEWLTVIGDQGSEGMNHLREAQVPYNSDFTPKKDVLSQKHLLLER